MRDALSDQCPASRRTAISKRLRGLDYDEQAAVLAQRALEITLVELAQSAGCPVPVMVRIGDGQPGPFRSA